MSSKHIHTLIYFTIIIAVTTLTAACGKKGFTVEGQLLGGENKTIYIEELTPRDGALFIDSVKLDANGHFKFSYRPPYLTFYGVHVSPVDYILLLPHEGETIKLNGDYNNFCENYSVEGSPESILLWQIQDYSNMGVNLLKSLRDQDIANKATLSEEQYAEAKRTSDSICIDAFFQQRQYMQHFITDHSGSLTTLIALYKPFNVTRPLFPPETSLDVYRFVLTNLESQLPDNPHTINFKNTVEQYRYTYGDSESELLFDDEEEDELAIEEQ